ncbi:hypothetical protein E2562_026922 [Oryza meyeriana var. granulata]|uniref:Uncharacterized protein n=1 Tax=Oryza meyeriana var. granulata TaxID=110450 RepID=A0A6G1CUY4_9ORYZ|nr:hypothetical protein E2562_026922 [Oryza meyeriana var. granulata]
MDRDMDGRGMDIGPEVLGALVHGVVVLQVGREEKDRGEEIAAMDNIVRMVGGRPGRERME